MRRLILLSSGVLGGLLAAVLVRYAWAKLASELTPWGVIAIVVLAGLILWSKALFPAAHVAHRAMPIHKYLMPCAFSVVGALHSGLAGFAVGLLVASALLSVSEFRMHDFMYHRTQGAAGEPGAVTAFCLVGRLLAGAVVAFVLWKMFALEWTTVGEGELSMLLTSPVESSMSTFASLGALFGFLYELSEHITGALFRMV